MKINVLNAAVWPVGYRPDIVSSRHIDCSCYYQSVDPTTIRLYWIFKFSSWKFSFLTTFKNFINATAPFVSIRKLVALYMTVWIRKFEFYMTLLNCWQFLQIFRFFWTLRTPTCRLFFIYRKKLIVTSKSIWILTIFPCIYNTIMNLMNNW